VAPKGLLDDLKLLKPGFVDRESQARSVVIEIDAAVLRLGLTLEYVPEQRFDDDLGGNI
jgi:hypothetical protein